MADLINQLKNDILMGVLTRGVPLRQQDLSARYNVSRIPIRDAIATLKNQGWLVSHGKVGVMVPVLNWTEAEDLYQTRAVLECRLLSFAAPNITNEIIGRSQDLNEQLGASNLSLLERGQLNWEFHANLYKQANRPTLYNIVALLNDQIRQYMGFQYGPLAYKEISQKEHEDLLLFLSQKNTSSALSLLNRHIVEAGIEMVNYIKSLNID